MPLGEERAAFKGPRSKLPSSIGLTRAGPLADSYPDSAKHCILLMALDLGSELGVISCLLPLVPLNRLAVDMKQDLTAVANRQAVRSLWVIIRKTTSGSHLHAPGKPT